jgi:hypothetical protein
MEKQSQVLINDSDKIIKFERDIDMITGQEVGKIEVKSLDGHREYITLDDNAADEIEKQLFKYLKNK